MGQIEPSVKQSCAWDNEKDGVWKILLNKKNFVVAYEKIDNILVKWK